jgi:hypothetical protein
MFPDIGLRRNRAIGKACDKKDYSNYFRLNCYPLHSADADALEAHLSGRALRYPDVKNSQEFRTGSGGSRFQRVGGAEIRCECPQWVESCHPNADDALLSAMISGLAALPIICRD